MNFIQFEIKDKIGFITVHRPEKLNALNHQTIAELSETVSLCLNSTDVRGVILTGSGEKAFVAGADISELRLLNRNTGTELARNNQAQVFNKIAKANKPFIACINGYALGGGLELALACHIRYASENAVLGLPELSLGIIPGYGGTQRLAEIIGKSKALELILTSDTIKADEALRLGLVNSVQPLTGLIPYAVERLNTIFTKSISSIQGAMKALYAQGDKDLNGYGVEIEEFGKLFDTKDFIEGTQAFLEKRKPNFSGN